MSARVNAGATKASPTANGSAAVTLVQLEPERLPIDHSVRSRSSRSSLTYAMRPVSAPAMAAMATPDSSNVAIDSAPPRLEIQSSTSDVTSPPKKAATGSA